MTTNTNTNTAALRNTNLHTAAGTILRLAYTPSQANAVVDATREMMAGLDAASDYINTTPSANELRDNFYQLSAEDFNFHALRVARSFLAAVVSIEG